jgi:hypothetical protein
VIPTRPEITAKAGLAAAIVLLAPSAGLQTRIRGEQNFLAKEKHPCRFYPRIPIAAALW